ncbi:hypothetical protein ACIPWY_11845 [Streptomyces sp. NPDC090032]|uniref:hypothetical protein n=1 Tax=unclassified Streptomyces TaxID=2593676 RepID=UPI0037195B4D
MCLFLGFQHGAQWSYVLLGVAFCVFGGFQRYDARRFHLRARRGMVPADTSFDSYPTGQYVLYLRAFDKDTDFGRTAPLSDWRQWWSLGNFLGYADADRAFRTIEERNVAELSRFGPVVAVGRPGEDKPFLGANRVYVTNHNWKSVVTDAIKNARLVVMVAAIGSDRKRYEGTLWEYTEILRLMPPQQVLLLMQDNPDEYENFRREATRRFHKQAKKRGWRTASTAPNRAPELPPTLQRSLRVGRHGDWPLRGLIRFDEDWTARLSLPEAAGSPYRGTHRARARRSFRAQIVPELDAMEVTLPGTAQTGRRGVFRAGFHSFLLFSATLIVGWWWFTDAPLTLKIAGITATIGSSVGIVRLSLTLNRGYQLLDSRVAG